MKKVFLGTLFCLIFTLSSSFANDGVFYAKGNTLIPLQETQIRLQKELLKFFVRDFQYVDVEINFEFYNPGNAKTVTVGFVSPPASGDVDENKNHPRISNFTVNVNGQKIPFKVKKMKESAFQADNREIFGEDYVYYFPVQFKPGLNKIRHTYRFQGGASVETQRDFDYQITTGKRWANKQIDDFELQVHLDRGIFYIPLSFQKSGKPADWKIVGRGTFSRPQTGLFGGQKLSTKLVQLQSGYLSLRKKNFKPDIDISIGEYNWNTGWHNRMCKISKECLKIKESGNNFLQYFRVKPSKYVTQEELSQLTKPELRIIRNYSYAIRGYEFKTAALKNFYSRFFWYKPNRNLDIARINLSEAEESFIRKTKSVEKRK